MTQLPRDLQTTIEFFGQLPGIGPKTAKRLGFYLLRLPQQVLKTFSDSVGNLKENAVFCQQCHNIAEGPLCSICSDSSRDPSVLVIVEDVMDLLSLESGTQFTGMYHVLHGKIDPLNYIGPDDLYIPHLFERVKETFPQLKEIILATNPTTEGEATAMYIRNGIRELLREEEHSLQISRLAYGLPMGGEVEYADYMTLKRAIDGRRHMD